MIKTLTNLLKQDKEKFVVPKGVQDCIPITAIYDDGIFRVGKDKYSKSFKFTDINFAVASREDKEAMFLEYSELLNSLDSGATTKLTINNRRLNRLDFEKTILIPETGDELDVYREEYNKMLLDKATGANAIVQDKYVTISINKKSVEDARTYFARVGADLIAHFARLGSKCVELETDERLRIVHDFFRVGEETAYHFNIKETRKKGHDFKDYVCPDTMEFEKDYFKMGNSVRYDVLEMSGSRAVWKDVLAVYSVKVNTDPNNPMEVATVDETKKQLLSDIFWEMNDISSRTESKTHTEIEESDDGHGNIVQTETTVTETFLYITVSHKTVDEMAAMYGFNQEQKEYLAELLKDENNQLWSQVLYGIGYSDDQIVTVALSQVGNVGGQPYWSWYGFDSRVEWCACFVSWCANECGYIDAGIIPKYAGCVNGVQWFRDRGQWADGSYEPSPGTIIFFDWEGDGVTDHTGIVQKCENGTVYTVEGNSGDTCRTKTYTVGSSVIYGYGIPAY